MIATRDPIVYDGNYDMTCRKYCGFLDLDIDQFTMVQEALLLEQIRLVADTPIGQQFIGGRQLRNSRDFRNAVPLTTYEDYRRFLDTQNVGALAEKPKAWVRTSDSTNSFRWVPYTSRAYERMMDNLMGAFILACTPEPGVCTLSAGDRVLFNVAPSPYLSGIIAAEASRTFPLIPVIPPDIHDAMEFKEKTKRGLELALEKGVDIIVSLTSVLCKSAEQFNNHSGNGHFSKYLRQPAALPRLVRAMLHSKMSHRGLMPRDLWHLKAVIGWGIDTHAYSKYVGEYWGAAPYEFHACTEAGIMAMQSWTRRGMTFVPDANFYEFIPEEEWLRSLRDRSYQPRTVLLNEVEAGKRYELVITHLYGMPLLRYRVGHLIKITALSDSEAGVQLPQMTFEGRADELIDFAGFTRLSERTITQAIASLGIPGANWASEKRLEGDRPVLDIYMELADGDNPEACARILHERLKSLDQFYSDLDTMMAIQPVRVVALPAGTFGAYYRFKTEAGFPLTERTPPRINTPPEALNLLVRLVQTPGSHRAALVDSPSPAIPTRRPGCPVPASLAGSRAA